MRKDTSRRRLLRLTGSVLGTGVLAGCLGSGSDNDGSGASPSPTTTAGGGGSTPTSTETATPTATETNSATPTDSPTPTPTPVPTVEQITVLLEGAPNGLQKYKIAVTTGGAGTIASVKPILISGDQFQIVGGGEGTSAVEARAADIVDNVGSFSEAKALFRVTYEQPVPEADLSMAVSSLVNDASESMNTDRVTISSGKS